uniref:Uncharacterized protein n=1 Tax=Arundo donax TaxID=35708 RepID=A0A0A9CWT2_ARUDO
MQLFILYNNESNGGRTETMYQNVDQVKTFSSLYLILTSGLGDFIFFFALRRYHLSWLTLAFLDIFFFDGGCFRPAFCFVPVSPTANLANPPSVFSVTAVLPYLIGWPNHHHLRPLVASSDRPQERATEGDKRAPPCNRSQEPGCQRRGGEDRGTATENPGRDSFHSDGRRGPERRGR